MTDHHTNPRTNRTLHTHTTPSSRPDNEGIPNFESTDLAAEGDADAGDDEIRRLKEDDEDEGEGETDKDGGVTDGKDEKANNIASSANYEVRVIVAGPRCGGQPTRSPIPIH